MDETNDDTAGPGHNQPPDPDGERGREAMRNYDINIAKEQVSRDDAIADAVRYGNALIAGRTRSKTNNEFGDWIKAQGLDRHRLFGLRQERQAAIQIAEIVAHVAKETVDSTTTVNPFARCPNNRPTNIMTWWRGKHTGLLTMAHAKTVGERAAILLRDHRAQINDALDIEYLERLARDPYALLMTSDVYEEAVTEFEIKFGLRPAPPKPAAASPAPAPAPASCAAHRAQGRQRRS